MTKDLFVAYFLKKTVFKALNSIVPDILFFRQCDQMCVFRGNLSSKTLKCYISLTIYCTVCKTRVCHVPSVVNDLYHIKFTLL